MTWQNMCQTYIAVNISAAPYVPFQPKKQNNTKQKKQKTITKIKTNVLYINIDRW